MAGKLTLSVSQLNEYIRRTLQMDPMLHGIELRGEISNLKFHQTGTLFFTLKDELAAISCVMYASEVESLTSMPFEGMRVIAGGNVSLYVRGGQMQFYVNHLRAQGVGVLYERLLALKAKLSEEGLFAPERKRPIPVLPDTVGVVTSPTGAVIHDILHVALRRNPNTHILLCPVRVQGIGAAEEVVSAIHLLEKLEHVSVIIVARGGGSMEDLWTFNEEAVVRAVASCKKPIVSAVGHETDVTLCDLAADLRAPTPSAAAECIVPVRDELLQHLEGCRKELNEAMRRQIERRETALEMMKAKMALFSPKNRLEHLQQRLTLLQQALLKGIRFAAARSEERLSLKCRELEALSPHRVLSRGYAIVLHDGIPVRSASQFSGGERITLCFADDQIQARILAAPDQEEEK